MHRRQCEQVIDAPGFPHSTSLQTQPREAYQPAERKTWLAQDAESKQTVTAKQRPATKKPATKQSAAKKKPSTKSSKK
jgi:hypothetical protein